jgi:hypothetical protein
MSRGLIAALSGLCLLTGCEKTRDLFEITSDLESNTCGANALPLPDGLSYKVQLKTDPPKATWKVVPKGAPITGKYDEADESFVFTASQTLSLGDIDAGTAGCTVIREETLEGTLALAEADAGSDAGDDDDDPPLVGEHRIDFRADPNGTCRNANGPLGVFERLPCEARYSITGEPQPAR